MTHSQAADSALRICLHGNGEGRCCVGPALCLAERRSTVAVTDKMAGVSKWYGNVSLRDRLQDPIRWDSSGAWLIVPGGRRGGREDVS
jgi:hypothetical protein